MKINSIVLTALIRLIAGKKLEITNLDLKYHNYDNEIRGYYTEEHQNTRKKLEKELESLEREWNKIYKRQCYCAVEWTH